MLNFIFVVFYIIFVSPFNCINIIFWYREMHQPCSSLLESRGVAAVGNVTQQLCCLFDLGATTWTQQTTCWLNTSSPWYITLPNTTATVIRHSSIQVSMPTEMTSTKLQWCDTYPIAPENSSFCKVDTYLQLLQRGYGNSSPISPVFLRWVMTINLR